MAKKSIPMDAAFINTDEEVFIVDNELKEYVKKSGFQFRVTDGPLKYYVNEKGLQIRIDFEEGGEVALLTPRGDVIYRDQSIRIGQLDKFIGEGAL